MTTKKRAPKEATKDYYLDFLRAEEALRDVAQRDGAVQTVLRAFRARLDQQCAEVEMFTREWDSKIRELGVALNNAKDLAENLGRACEIMKPAKRR